MTPGRTASDTGSVAAEWYLVLLLLAALEASPAGYFLPGTLVVVAAGGMVQAGRLDASLTLLAVWLGVFLGDVITFAIARKFKNALRRWKTVAGALTRAETRLDRLPVAFLFSHFSPFLKNIVAPAAGVMGMSWSRFLAWEIAAALLDAVWFLSVGFFVTSSFGTLGDAPAILRVIGTVAFFAVVIFFIGRGRTCAVPRASS